MMQMALSNAVHPEYGVVTIPFPIPEEEYGHCLELLEALEIGNAVSRDCKVQEVQDGPPILKRLEGSRVNLDELDYLAKRLDSFTDQELAQFQSAAVSYDYSNIVDLINLTFSCQEVTVITDFSDLESIGRNHYMTLNGGSARMEELDNLDGTETALLLIESGDGVITPYGVVYDNCMSHKTMMGAISRSITTHDARSLSCFLRMDARNNRKCFIFPARRAKSAVLCGGWA